MPACLLLHMSCPACQPTVTSILAGIAGHARHALWRPILCMSAKGHQHTPWRSMAWRGDLGVSQEHGQGDYLWCLSSVLSAADRAASPQEGCRIEGRRSSCEIGRHGRRGAWLRPVSRRADVHDDALQRHLRPRSNHSLHANDLLGRCQGPAHEEHPC